MKILFSPVDPSEGEAAFSWHKAYAATNDLLLPREPSEFECMVNEGQIWCAKDTGNNYLALAYSNFDCNANAYEIGGLMVATGKEKIGIGSTITRLTLGHLLFEESPLENGYRIIAHIHALNPKPRPLFEKALKFEKTDSVCIPGEKLPGLRVNAEGMVVGDELSLVSPDTLIDLANWCMRWPGTLKDGSPAEIELREDISLSIWADAFKDMIKFLL